MADKPKITCEIMAEDVAWLEGQARKFGGIVNAHFGGVVKWMKARFSKTIESGGGVYGVPSFSPRAGITMRLHGRRWGGNIPKKSLAKAWRKNGAQMVGIPDNNPATVAFGRSLQTAETRTFTRGEKAFFRRRGVDEVLRPQYNRPARPLVKAFAESNCPEMFHEIRKRTEKTLSDEAKIQEMNAKIRAKAAKRAALGNKRAIRSARAKAAYLRGVFR